MHLVANLDHHMCHSILNMIEIIWINCKQCMSFTIKDLLPFESFNQLNVILTNSDFSLCRKFIS